MNMWELEQFLRFALLSAAQTQEAESLVSCCMESQIESLDQRHKAIPGQSIMEKWHGYS